MILEVGNKILLVILRNDLTLLGYVCIPLILAVMQRYQRVRGRNVDLVPQMWQIGRERVVQFGIVEMENSYVFNVQFMEGHTHIVDRLICKLLCFQGEVVENLENLSDRGTNFSKLCTERQLLKFC